MSSFARWGCVKVVFAAVALMGVPPSLAALPAVDDKWQRHESPNFELYSRNGRAESREILRNLELLRAVFVDRFKLVERRRQPVTVYSFRSTADFRAYAPATWGTRHEFTGFHHDGVERAVIVLGPIRDWESARALVFHEYVHHLFRATEEQPPTWFNEGVAELFASLVVEGKTIQFGKPNFGRILEIRDQRLMPLAELFAIDHDASVFRENRHTGLFYAQSWALLHYWHFGRSDIPAAKVDEFLRVVRLQPAPPPDALRSAFREVFGMDYPAMEERLSRYVRTGSFKWHAQPLPEIPGPETYPSMGLSRDEIRLRLAELALRVNKSAEAKLALLDAAGGATPDIRALELLGTDFLLEGDRASAKEFWERAISAGSQNPAVHRELALLESEMWFRRFDYYFRQPQETTERLRSLIGRSLAFCPEQTAGYQILAWVEAYAAKPSVRNINLVQKRMGQIRDNRETLLALAMIRHRLDDNETALRILDQLDKLEPHEWIGSGSALLRSKIEGSPNQGRGIRGPAGQSAPPIRIRAPAVRAEVGR